MAESIGILDSKTRVTLEEITERCKLAREAFAETGRVKAAWAAGAHALKSWPPRNPLELRRLAQQRMDFKLQEAPPPAPSAKPDRRPKAAVAKPRDAEEVLVVKGHAVGPSGPTKTTYAAILELPSPLSRVFMVLGFDPHATVVSLELMQGRTIVELADGRRLGIWSQPALNRTGA